MNKYYEMKLHRFFPLNLMKFNWFFSFPILNIFLSKAGLQIHASGRSLSMKVHFSFYMSYFTIDCTLQRSFLVLGLRDCPFCICIIYLMHWPRTTVIYMINHELRQPNRIEIRAIKAFTISDDMDARLKHFASIGTMYSLQTQSNPPRHRAPQCQRNSAGQSSPLFSGGLQLDKHVHLCAV
jgi:hypothetical protein